MRTIPKTISSAVAVGAAMLVGAGLPVPSARAAYIVTLEQVGINVVATGSGSLNLTGLSASCPTSCETNAGLTPILGTVSTGPVNSVPSLFYTGPIVGPTSFGDKDSSFANVGSGDIVAIDGYFKVLSVPLDYVSGTALSDISIYEDSNFFTLGVTPGTYEWTWGSGATADNFTLIIGTATVPAPAIGHGLPAALAIGGLLIGASLSERKKRLLQRQPATVKPNSQKWSPMHLPRLRNPD